jgi:hypothetical protein
MKGGENLGDEESSEEEKEVTRLDSSAGSKATCSRRYFLVLILVSRDTLILTKSATWAWV